METRFRHLMDKLRASLWFVPGLMTLGAVALSVLTLRIDAHVLEGSSYPFRLFTAGPAGASDVLSTIAGSMMSVMGVTFSITVVALSLASSQFGPRLLRNFIRDRGNQFVLGTFLATFTYTLLALRVVSHEDEGQRVPELTITVALLLAMASVGVLIYFVHHVAVSIQADTVIANVQAELDESIERMYPEEMGEEAEASDATQRLPEAPPDAVRVRADRAGYVQAIDEEDVMEVAQEHDLVLVLRRRPGDFVGEDGLLLLAWPAARVDDAVRERLRDAILLGRRRTTEQDVEMSVDQLVEIAVRALSPGINDPFTAIRCIDRLGAALGRLCRRRIPGPLRKDSDGRLRVVLRSTTFQGIVDEAFDQIRQHARGNVAVTLRLLESIEAVAASVRTEPQRLHLERHADKTLRTSLLAEHEESDAREILGRHERALAALADARARIQRPPDARQAS